MWLCFKQDLLCFIQNLFRHPSSMDPNNFLLPPPIQCSCHLLLTILPAPSPFFHLYFVAQLDFFLSVGLFLLGWLDFLLFLFLGRGCGIGILFVNDWHWTPQTNHVRISNFESVVWINVWFSSQGLSSWHELVFVFLFFEIFCDANQVYGRCAE